MEEYEESFNFGETIVEVAKEKQRTMSDEGISRVALSVK